MSMRKMLVQYIGCVLNLPELEREVKKIAIRDKDFRIIQWFIPERTCHDLSPKGYNRFHCSACNMKIYRADQQFNYCPNCGARVVE